MPISTLQSGSFPSNVAIDTDTLVVDGANNRVGINQAAPAHPVHVGTDDLIVDASGNLLVGKTASNVAVAGAEIRPSGFTGLAVDGGAGLTIRRLTSDGELQSFFKDTTKVGSIGIQASGFYIDGESGHEGMRFANGAITPRENGSDSDGTSDLGASNNRFKDLYLSGGVYLGGTAAANLLHYYEEGAWTPALNGGLTPSIYQASYTVIGNRVFLTCNITVPTNSVNAAIIVSGLPYSTLHDGSGALSYTNAQTTNDFFILVQGSQIYFYKGIGTTNYLLSDFSGYILRFTAQYNINN